MCRCRSAEIKPTLRSPSGIAIASESKAGDETDSKRLRGDHHADLERHTRKMRELRKTIVWRLILTVMILATFASFCCVIYRVNHYRHMHEHRIQTIITQRVHWEEVCNKTNWAYEIQHKNGSMELYEQCIQVVDITRNPELLDAENRQDHVNTLAFEDVANELHYLISNYFILGTLWSDVVVPAIRVWKEHTIACLLCAFVLIVLFMRWCARPWCERQTILARMEGNRAYDLHAVRKAVAAAHASSPPPRPRFAVPELAGDDTTRADGDEDGMLTVDLVEPTQRRSFDDMMTNTVADVGAVMRAIKTTSQSLYNFQGEPVRQPRLRSAAKDKDA